MVKIRTCAVLISAALAVAQTPSAPPGNRKLPSRSTHPEVAAKPPLKVCAACIRAHMEFLASDALRGRGSGTADELLAATYVASQLRAYGIEPAGDDGGYLQRAPTVQAKVTSAPQITVSRAASASSGSITWTYGTDFLITRLTLTKFSGPLRKIPADQVDPESPDVEVAPGAVVLITGLDRKKIRRAVGVAYAQGVIAILVAARDEQRFSEAPKELPQIPAKLAGESSAGLGGEPSVLELSKAAVATLSKLPDGSEVRFEAPSAEEEGSTWNAVGILRGSDSQLRSAAVLFSAHLDHLGIGPAVNGDTIYNGADDDASGVTAVLELARVLGAGPRPQRTVIFALFGSEEVGGLGSTYFEDHPPLPLKNIAANLEFEMLGRADPKVREDTVWLTGWERSNLGPTLAAHGAKLVGDPHPDQNFFARSDNYVLAKKGVVAQTISSYGLHSDYHQPSDDVAHLDFKHMDAAIESLLAPVGWLVNSRFRPQWNKGGQP